MTTTDVRTEYVDEELLARFDERAPKYDHDNEFFTEDFEELRDRGYFLASLPAEYGGAGLDLKAINAIQRRIAYVAPATAVAVNMHHYWVGMCADMHRAGDPSGDWVLEKAAEGHIFAAGHGEAGNDLPLLLSTTKAERVDGGWEITGHKIFGSLSPVWTYLGLHAQDNSDPANPKIVHGFLHRDTPGYRIEETWDTMGMRATMSNDTILDKTFIPDEATMLVTPAGFAGGPSTTR
jgi:alkylation response protein AidB-like acyl-CoA dehydrogenase